MILATKLKRYGMVCVINDATPCCANPLNLCATPPIPCDTTDTSIAPPSSPCSPSTAAPSYSPEPYEDEHRLDFVARKQPRGVPTGTYVKKSSGITLRSGQESGVTLPSYTRNGIVQGKILDEEATVQSVIIELEGHQTVTVAELFSCTKTVWSKIQGSCPSASTCPAVLPFDLPFLRGYTDSDGQNTKPPRRHSARSILVSQVSTRNADTPSLPPSQKLDVAAGNVRKSPLLAILAHRH